MNFFLTTAVLLTALAQVSAGVMLVPTGTNATVLRVNAVGISTSWISAGLMVPEQVIIDANGDALVADSGLGQVLRFPAGGGPSTVVGTPVPGVTSLAFDPSGVLHVTCATDRTLRKLTPGNTFEILATFPLGTEPRSLVIDAGGTLYVADRTGNRILEVNSAGVYSDFSTEVTAPYALAFDNAGKLHATDATDGGRLVTFNPTGKARPFDNNINLGTLRGLAFDEANTAHFLTSAGDLKKLAAGGAALIASGLGDVRLLTARSASRSVLAFSNQVLAEPAGAVFSVLNSPARGAGVTAFKASLKTGIAAVTLANNYGIWKSNDAGTLTLLARRGSAPPGLPDAKVSLLGDPIVSSSGKVAFTTTLTTGVGGVTLSTATAVISDATGALGPVLRKGEQALGQGLDPAVKFTGFRQLVLPGDSGPAVLATISGPGVNTSNNLGLWSVAANGTVSLVVRKGDIIPFADKSRKLSGLSLFTAPVLCQGQGRHAAANRQFTFRATFTDGFTALLLVQPGLPPAIVAERRGPVGATLPNALFSLLGSPAVSDNASDFASRSTMLSGTAFGGVTLSSSAGIFTQAAGVNTLEARATFPAPGVTNAIFSTLADPVVSSGGAYAFFARMKSGFGGVTLATSGGLWADLGTGLQLIARQGATAPGVPGTVRFTAFSRCVLPANYGPSFTANIAGTGITTANNFGVWAHDGAGATNLLLRKGDKIAINGPQRTLSLITIYRSLLPLAGQSRHFDKDGSICALVRCTDGTRAIVAVTPP
jgi:hypothetical protein